VREGWQVNCTDKEETGKGRGNGATGKESKNSVRGFELGGENRGRQGKQGKNA